MAFWWVKFARADFDLELGTMDATVVGSTILGHPFLSYNVGKTIINQWEFQDPKMEVLYHIMPYVLGIFPYIGLI